MIYWNCKISQDRTKKTGYSLVSEYETSDNDRKVNRDIDQGAGRYFIDLYVNMQ